MKSNFLICCATLLFACASDTHQEVAIPVATWQEITIDLDEFEEEYMRYASMAPIQDSPDARIEYAYVMLERKVIATLGAEQGLDSLREVQLDIRRKRETALRRAYLESIAKPKLRIPGEEEIREGFQRSNTRLLLEQLYANDQPTIQRYAARLRGGERFETVAIESMRKAGVPDSSYRMGWVGFEMMDEAPETVAFSLRDSGQVSEPVKSLRGWHIFRLLARKETFYADGSTFQNARENIAFKLYHRRFEEITVPFTDSLMRSHRLVTYLDRLQQAWVEIAPLVPSTISYLSVLQMNQELLALKPQRLSRATPLAMVGNQAFTFGQLMDRLPDLPVETLTPNLRAALEIAIRDSVLAARAEQAGMAERKEVVFAEQVARTTALYYATLRAAADTARVEAPTPERIHQQLLPKAFQRKEVIINRDALTNWKPRQPQ